MGAGSITVGPGPSFVGAGFSRLTVVHRRRAQAGMSIGAIKYVWRKVRLKPDTTMKVRLKENDGVRGRYGQVREIIFSGLLSNSGLFRRGTNLGCSADWAPAAGTLAVPGPVPDRTMVSGLGGTLAVCG